MKFLGFIPVFCIIKGIKILGVKIPSQYFSFKCFFKAIFESYNTELFVA